MRLYGTALALTLALLVLTGCSTHAPDSGYVIAPSTSPSARPAPEPTPWAGPADGTWSFGDIGFEQPYKHLYDEWQVRVRGLPQFGQLQPDGQVTVTGSFLVERLEDHGNGASAAGDNHFFFRPGNRSHLDDESYGVYTTVKCDADQVAAGESTTCNASFTAPTDEMQNFYWIVNAKDYAAWPSQVP